MTIRGKSVSWTTRVVRSEVLRGHGFLCTPLFPYVRLQPLGSQFINVEFVHKKSRPVQSTNNAYKSSIYISN